MQYLFGIVLSLLSLFLILLVLVQRGRGGGLTGALGGAGGGSAFGAKAGDTFTRVTSVVTLVWILLCSVALAMLQTSGDSKLQGGTTAPPITGAVGAPAAEGETPAATRFNPGDDAAPAATTPDLDQPATEAPKAETPAAPAAEAPQTEAPAAEAPAAEAPKSEEKPAAE
ncbi:preprotein translocase subunit SecG [Blastopirellula marina]|uniref:Protein-export membrane protein SecG n=1 Tax=Blastopirellula marina DSM 3645 TaxID=314230 RepID=A4A1G4_9BACT|nr:preprotein translocase subunit SecG [Blastopirellula marina]EAQ77413.1 hypothetical protein DSM3645_04590 [Blastopirellula marina DSM 3645]